MYILSFFWSASEVFESNLKMWDIQIAWNDSKLTIQMNTLNSAPLTTVWLDTEWTGEHSSVAPETLEKSAAISGHKGSCVLRER